MGPPDWDDRNVGIRLDADQIAGTEWAEVRRERVPADESTRTSLIVRYPPSLDIPSLDRALKRSHEALRKRAALPCRPEPSTFPWELWVWPPGSVRHPSRSPDYHHVNGAHLPKRDGHVEWAPRRQEWPNFSACSLCRVLSLALSLLPAFGRVLVGLLANLASLRWVLTRPNPAGLFRILAGARSSGLARILARATSATTRRVFAHRHVNSSQLRT